MMSLVLDWLAGEYASLSISIASDTISPATAASLRHMLSQSRFDASSGSFAPLVRALSVMTRDSSRDLLPDDGRVSRGVLSGQGETLRVDAGGVSCTIEGHIPQTSLEDGASVRIETKTIK